MVAYLLPLIERLHCVWHVVRREQYESVAKEKERLAHLWRSWPEKTPGDEVLDALCGVRLLAPLTKKTAHGWAKTGLVPLIMATDARDWNHCAEPMLRNIAEQKGVKSRATFKSRLLAAVSHTCKVWRGRLKPCVFSPGQRRKRPRKLRQPTASRRNRTPACLLRPTGRRKFASSACRNDAKRRGDASSRRSNGAYLHIATMDGRRSSHHRQKSCPQQLPRPACAGANSGRVDGQRRKMRHYAFEFVESVLRGL